MKYSNGIRKILWFIWKKKVWSTSVTYVIFIGSLYYIYNKYEIPSNDLLELLVKLFSYLSKEMQIKYPLISICLNLILPGLVILMFGYITRYILLPGNKSVNPL